MNDATFSSDGIYRYMLRRHKDVPYPEQGTAFWIMLNPSTADATLDDATIRRCRGFAREWRCNGIVVANLYALRATNPAELWKHPDPIGTENDIHLASMINEFKEVVCAWGSKADELRVDHVVRLIRKCGGTCWCLGTTQSGAPRHPLYVKTCQPLVHWKQAELLGH